MLSTFLIAICLAPVQIVDSVTTPHYHIVASISPDQSYLDARVVLQVPRTAFGSSDSIHLALGRSGIRGIRLTKLPLLSGRQIPFRITSDSNELVLPLEPGATAAISLTYRITIDTAGRRQLGYDLFAATDSRSAWYPTLLAIPDSVRRFSNFDVNLEAPPGIAILSSGTVIDSATGATSVRRQFRGEHLEGFALAFAPAYVVRSHPADGVIVRTFSPRADTLIWDRVAAETAKAATWYQRTYGFFPVRDIGIVPGNPGFQGGFPMPNMFMIHQGNLSPDFIRFITAHELAHYYWGLYVLSSAERLDWLMLGLGIWTDEWYLAQTAGIPLEAQWRSPHGDNSFEYLAISSIAHYDQRLGLAEVEADSFDYDYNTYVRHGKGSVALYLLSLRIGPERFVAFQRSLLSEFRYHRLSPALFANRLEAIGDSGAARFLQAWIRADARLDYAIRGARADTVQPGAYWIRVERTGTIPYPVTIEARPLTGPAVRVQLSGETSMDSVKVALGGMLQTMHIDPDGLLPMWSSSNVDMRRLYLRAMGTVGPVEPFLVLARSHLESDPDPTLAALLVERLFELGRFSEIQLLARQKDLVTRCLDRVTCLAALQVARALSRMGDAKEAGVLLRGLDAMMSAFGFGASRRLAVAHNEIPISR